MLSNVLLGVNIAVFAYFAVINGFYFILLMLSYFSLLKYRRRTEHEQWRRVVQSPLTVGVSVLAPAYNEESTIEESVKSLLTLEYADYEVVVVNDGSTDGTLEQLKRVFGLHQIPMDTDMRLPCQEIIEIYRSPDNPRLVVANKLNGGKADALNAGINVSSHPLICVIDADSLIEGEALLRATRPFLEKPETTVAVGGSVRVANGCDIVAGRIVRVGLANGVLPLIQTVEYLRTFLFGRLGWSTINCLLIISGAFGVFRKDIAIAAGGYRDGAVGEDMELVVRMHRHLREQQKPYRIYFLPDPVCWTEVPESMAALGGQRNRWQRGLIESLLLHRKMLFNPRYGAIGLFAVPYFFLFEMLAPLIELLGLFVVSASYATGLLDIEFFVLFLAVAILLGAVLTTGTLVLEELTFRRYSETRELLKLIAAAFAENLGYRQLTMWWRIKGWWDYLKGDREWGRMDRKGFGKT